MDHVSRLIAFVAVACLPSVAFGAWPDCVDDGEIAGTWSAGGNPIVADACGGTPGSYESAKACGIAASGGVFLETYQEYCNSGAPDCTQYFYRFKRTDGVWPQFLISRTAITPAVCPDEPECEALMNQRQLGTHTGGAEYSPPADICVDGCAAFKRDIQTTSGPTRYWRVNDGGGVFNYLVSYQFTGLPCDDEPVIPVEDMTSEGETCIGDFCRGPQTGENCGFLNDKWTCLNQVTPDKCFKNSDGSVVCAETAPMPPKPDNGTPGVPATPDATVEACTGANSCQQINQYSSTTVGGSSRPVPDGSGTGGSGPIGGDGEGSGEETTGPVGQASGGAVCDTPPTCTHDDPVQCAMLNQQWRTRCVDAISAEDALAAIGATEAEQEGDLTGGADPIEITSLNADGGFSGSCPAPISVTVMGRTLSLDIWLRACEMAVLFAPVVMMMGYLIAIGIIVKGVKA